MSNRLTGPLGAFIQSLMQKVAGHLLLILCTLVFFGGAPISLGMHPAAALETCAGHHADETTAHQHGMKNGNCVACCIGACVDVPDLASRSLSTIAPQRPATVAYPAYGVTISGRAVTPDPAPPKLSA